MATADSNERANVAPPHYNGRNPELFFLKLELYFTLAKITDNKIKCSIALGLVNEPELENIAANVLRKVQNGSAGDHYQEFKAAVLNTTALNNDQKLELLLNEVELGDRTPTQFLSYLQGLYGSDNDDPIIKTVFLRALSPQVRSILAVMKDATLKEMATAADKIQQNEGKNNSLDLLANINKILNNESVRKEESDQNEGSVSIKILSKINELVTRMDKQDALIRELTFDLNNRDETLARNRRFIPPRHGIQRRVNFRSNEPRPRREFSQTRNGNNSRTNEPNTARSNTNQLN